MIYGTLSYTKCNLRPEPKAQRSHKGANRVAAALGGLTLHDRLRARLAWTGRRSGARSRWRALDLRAPRPRARRTLSALRASLGASIDDDRLRRWDATLENILRKIRDWRALCLEHIAAHIVILESLISLYYKICDNASQKKGEHTMYFC